VLGVAFDRRGRLYAVASMRDLTIPFSDAEPEREGGSSASTTTERERQSWTG
jgi:hypothetical protein